MRSLAIGVSTFVFLGCAFASGTTTVTWGKPGVSFVEYRADAAECSFAGLTVKIPQNSSAEDAGVDGGLNDYLTNVHQYDLKRWHAEMEQRQAAVDGCLKGLGYRQFRLTVEQQARLDTFPAGTMQRHAYLYSLASDKAVLDAQAP